MEHPEHVQRASVFTYTQHLSRAPVRSKLPLRIHIPVLSVDAPIEPVGLTNDGAMAMPGDHDTVGWLISDVLPGNSGVSVMAGHYGARNSIFNRLHTLAIGDRIVVQSNAGSVSFLVLRIKEFANTERVSEIFVAQSPGSFLNLITCSGLWDSDAGEYASRIVVFTEKEVH
jgi:LPXTG-site transpeptidase (sortase) family protein